VTAVRISFGPSEMAVVVGAESFVLPVGIDTLLERELRTDPPRPEELTNAIAAVADELDDVVRLAPAIVGAGVEVAGADARAIAAVEVGGEARLPFMLSRDAAEDVFRTLATETRAERARNPGLPTDLVASVVAGSCAMVAVMRRLQLDSVTVLP
jgi:exopolyphosphatase/guanosine-5'-triphosphate,3'-diphosphate pyrophosphatase